MPMQPDDVRRKLTEVLCREGYTTAAAALGISWGQEREASLEVVHNLLDVIDRRTAELASRDATIRQMHEDSIAAVRATAKERDDLQVRVSALHDAHSAETCRRLALEAVLDEVLTLEHDLHRIDVEALRRRDAEVAELRAAKDGAYRERNMVVALLARMALALGWRAGLRRHEPEPDPAWDEDWKNVVAIDLPTGQVTWHHHDSDRALFVDDLPAYPDPWDGHGTEEKYRRVREALSKPRCSCARRVPVGSITFGPSENPGDGRLAVTRHGLDACPSKQEDVVLDLSGGADGRNRA